MSAPEPQTPLAMGIAWASRITALGFEFALPALLGDYLDRRLATRPVGLILGMALGFAVGMFHLLRIARDGLKPGPG